MKGMKRNQNDKQILVVSRIQVAISLVSIQVTQLMY